MSKHVFVSHSHKDSAVAESVVAALEQRGISCWIAPRDVPPGGSYAESILTAIESAGCFVLIYSQHSNVSSHVLREVERALKFGVNIVPVRFDDSTPSKSLDYLLATVHWLAIPEQSREHSIAKAAEQIAVWLTNFLKNPAAPLPARIAGLQSALVTSLQPPPKRNGRMLGAAMMCVLVAMAAYATGQLPFGKKNSPGSSTPVVNPASYAPQPAPTTASNTTKTTKAPLGYAGVNRPGSIQSNPPPGEPGMYPPPPPPPAMSQYGNGPGMAPNGGGALPPSPPPPPPPPPRGRPMFGPRNGPGPGMPPNGGEPKP